MRLLIAIMILLTISVPSFAEEMWACDGITHSSPTGSSTGPFLIHGNTDFYQMSGYQLRKVGENRASGNFDIYVDVSSNKNRAAYYIKKDSNQMEIRRLLWTCDFFLRKLFTTIIAPTRLHKTLLKHVAFIFTGHPFTYNVKYISIT